MRLTIGSAGLLDRLVYLSARLALVLAFIGVKLVLHFAHLHNDAVPELPTWLSLGVIATVLAITAIASHAKTRAGPKPRGRREVSAGPDRWPPRRPRSQMASGSAP